MEWFVLFFTLFSFVHVFALLKTSHSAFYWLSKMLLILEAIQIGGLRSIPIWYNTWKRMYILEAGALKKQISEAK